MNLKTAKIIRAVTILLFTFHFSLSNVPAQSPQKMSYQAVIRTSNNTLLISSPVGMRISILRDSATGTPVYTEIQTPTTSTNGLITIQIGGGTGFNAIDWAKGPYFLKTETDPGGGSNYTLTGTSQLLSVPYALYAAKSGNPPVQNNITSISTVGDTLYIGSTYIIVPGVSMANACRMDFADTVPYTRNFPHAGDNPYNSSLYGLPKFILKNYIELDKIDSISRYRSGVGHDYSDSYEACRSMKHYFKPGYDEDWSSVKIFSPVNGTISNSFPESIGGNQVWITPFGMPAFNVSIFHVNLSIPLNIGDTVRSGQQIGTHTGPQTTSDIAIQIMAPNSTFQRVSYFDVMTDRLFACYMSRGIMTRDELIISKAARDADPLFPCNGNQFFVTGTINNWVTLH